METTNGNGIDQLVNALVGTAAVETEVETKAEKPKCECAPEAAIYAANWNLKRGRKFFVEGPVCEHKVARTRDDGTPVLYAELKAEMDRELAEIAERRVARGLPAEKEPVVVEVKRVEARVESTGETSGSGGVSLADIAAAEKARIVSRAENERRQAAFVARVGEFTGLTVKLSPTKKGCQAETCLGYDPNYGGTIQVGSARFDLCRADNAAAHKAAAEAYKAGKELPFRFVRNDRGPSRPRGGAPRPERRESAPAGAASGAATASHEGAPAAEKREGGERRERRSRGGRKHRSEAGSTDAAPGTKSSRRDNNRREREALQAAVDLRTKEERDKERELEIANAAARKAAAEAMRATPPADLREFVSPASLRRSDEPQRAHRSPPPPPDVDVVNPAFLAAEAKRRAVEAARAQAKATPPRPAEAEAPAAAPDATPGVPLAELAKKAAKEGPRPTGTFRTSLGAALEARGVDLKKIVAATPADPPAST